MWGVPARIVYLDYPRADNRDEDGDPIGAHEMVELTGRSRQAVDKWFERGMLPLADGPRVWGKPTWTRSTFLAWAYRNEFTLRFPGQRRGDPVFLPVHAEAEEWAGRVPESVTTRLVDLGTDRLVEVNARWAAFKR